VSLRRYPMPDRAEVDRLLDYNPGTGHFTWKCDFGRAKKGDRAGWITGCGYVKISIKRRDYPAHRLAWLLMTGAAPPIDTDHVNGNKSDNRWANLRAATRSGNRANSVRAANNKSGYKGVRWCSRDRGWMAVVKKDGTRYMLGPFTTPEQAHQVYVRKAIELHGEFAYDGVGTRHIVGLRGV